MANLGMADLLAAADADADELPGVDATVDYRAEARSLCDWLLLARSRGYAGFCGGPRHAIQGLSGRGDPGDPDLVTTAYAARGLLAGGALDPVYPTVARTAAEFAREDLGYDERDGGLAVTYYENHPDDAYTINAGAVWAGLLLDLHDRFGGGDDRYRARAWGLLDHVADLQTDAGGWYYREPPEASHLSMDNHHNGFIIEAFQRYRDVVDDRYDDTLDAAVDFYRTRLFEPDGTPNFDEEHAYPRDIHASTQGALVFTKEGDFDFARTVLEWVFDELHAGDGAFYFRKERWFTRRVTLMRWCQAWMAFAMAEYLDARADQRSP
jgi:hypothetical protein